MVPVIAAAAGAAAMYFFDPQQGGRRRALLRDKFAWFKDEMGDVRETAGGRAEHLRNRAKGMIHEVKKTVANRTDGQSQTSMGDQDRDKSRVPVSEDYGTNTIQNAA
jgi:hypothetical protein